MASLPASLTELRLVGCRGVTAGASLGHLHALRVLHCIGTELAPAALAVCHARGCAVPAARVFRGGGRVSFVAALALLGDGRLASGDSDGEVRLWDVAAGGEATAVVRAGNAVHRLAALRDGRLAIGTVPRDRRRSGYIEVWDEVCPPRAVRPSTVAGVCMRLRRWPMAALLPGAAIAPCGSWMWMRVRYWRL